MSIGYSLGFIGLGNMGWPMAANVVASPHFSHLIGASGLRISESRFATKTFG